MPQIPNHESTKPHFINLHQYIARTPQDHISIDLLGQYNFTSQGISYALTTVCNLTGYLITAPIKVKKTMMVVTHLFSDIMLKFGFPRILHSDNGTEFKTKLIEHLSQQLGIKKTYNSPCHPQTNGKSESSHRFVKDCIQKFSIDSVLEWDQLLPYATAAFNWFPKEYSQESPHYLYFGCDPYLPHLAAFLQPTLRYLGLDKGMIHLDKLRQAHMLAALNTKEANSKQNKDKYDDVPQYKIGDIIMNKNLNIKSNWDTKYIPISRIIKLIDPKKLEIANLTGRL